MTAPSELGSSNGRAASLQEVRFAAAGRDQTRVPSGTNDAAGPDEHARLLDELLNLPRHAQKLLLDFAQFGSYRPLGYHGCEPKTADLRLISITNGDVRQAVADERFREDLY